MFLEDVLLIMLFLIIVTIAAIPLGKYMSNVFTGKKTFMTPVIRPLEKFIYRICFHRRKSGDVMEKICICINYIQSL